MEDGEQSPLLLGELNERAGLCKGDREGLVDDDMLACAEGGGGKREVAIVRAGDHHEVHIGVSGDVRGGTDGDAGQSGSNSIRPARSYDRQFESGDGLNERRVKGSSNITIADEANSNTFSSYRYHYTFIGARPALVYRATDLENNANSAVIMDSWD